MRPFKVNLIIYVLHFKFNVMHATIQQQSFKQIKNCSLPNHIQASEAVIKEINQATLTQCSSKCTESFQCGVVMFDRPNGICYLVDKDYQVCDETLGVYEMVSYIFPILFINGFNY